MASPSTSKALPTISSKPKGGALAKRANKKARQLMVILQDDYNFDVVKEMIDHYGVIKRGKKLKPVEKHRLMKDYLTFIASLCIPREVHDKDASKTGDKVQFNISIGQPNPEGQSDTKGSKPKVVKSGVSISIPTVKGDDGSFSVDESAI